MRNRLAVAVHVHDDTAFLSAALHAVAAAGPAFVFVSRVPWHGPTGDWEAAADAARAAGAEVVEGEWASELAHRRASRAWLLERGFTHCLVPDGDEVVEPALLDTLRTIARHSLAERVYVHMDTYWKTPGYVVRPRERLTPLLLFDLRHAQPVRIREYSGGRPLALAPEYGVLHHLSYVGSDARIRRKLETFSHRDEVVEGWLERIWLAWDQDRLLRSLHPTHPDAYGFAERIDVPRALQDVAAEAAAGPTFDLDPDPPLPTCAVVIPLHGGEDDIRACLQSLAPSVRTDPGAAALIQEVVVVDNASPDDAAAVAEAFAFARVVRLRHNAGFAAACNRGVAETTAEVVLFLNSDTVTPRIGLRRLLETVASSGSIAAAGPYTNNAGHFQCLDPTYTSLDTLDLFAEDFACRPAPDVDTDMLVGFCLAVKRSALREVGGFDERFGAGTFEDNDLCYRLRRAGYRLVVAARSFVHHAGSRTLRRMEAAPSGPLDLAALMRANEAAYRAKWHEDIDAGFASHLAGMAAGPIVFDHARRPEARKERARSVARQADISLCMIVRDEERVLADCLASARPFFREMIVVDTGSTDRTVEIAESFGACVHHFAWCDDFAAARNESLRYARGRWVFWMDADDTLPLATGEALQQAALGAPPDVAGFVVPVRFVDEGAGGGTQVDHVKLFRNLPGVRFEGRIHEQVLPSLRAAMPAGRIVRCGAVVLHSGYDTSPEGQARKRDRDLRLLDLQLAETPEHPFHLFNKGMTLHYLGQHEEAVGWLQRSLAASGPDDSQVRKAHALKVASLHALGRAAEALEACTAGLSAVPGDPELHFHAGRLLAEAGQHEEAHAHYQAVLAADTTQHFSSIDLGLLTYKTHFNLGGVCMALGRYPEARAWWSQALQGAPTAAPGARALYEAAMQVGDLAGARQAVEAMRAVDGPGPEWAEMLAGHAEAVGGPANAEATLSAAIAREPQAVGPQMALARRLLRQERVAEASGLLQSLACAGVAEAAYFMGIAATRRGAFAEALQWMERARALDPGHAETRQRVEELRRALGQPVE